MQKKQKNRKKDENIIALLNEIYARWMNYKPSCSTYTQANALLQLQKKKKKKKNHNKYKLLISQSVHHNKKKTRRGYGTMRD